MAPSVFTPVGDDLVATITQQVFDLHGEPLVEAHTVYHRYSFRDDKVSRMVVHDDEARATDSDR